MRGGLLDTFYVRELDQVMVERGLCVDFLYGADDVLLWMICRGWMVLDGKNSGRECCLFFA